MANILCIETATDICSICIAVDGNVIAIRETERSFSHSEVITVFVDECLKEAKLLPSQLSAVAITSGPGSYTALRIGTSTAKGLCYALNIPLIKVDTLKALACGVKAKLKSDELVVPMLDARRKEVYHAVYDHTLTELVSVAPKVLDEQSFLTYDTRIHFCGDGVEKAKDIITYPQAIFHSVLSSATYMVEEAFEKYSTRTFEDVAYYTPFYLKPANINVQKKNILFQK